MEILSKDSPASVIEQLVDNALLARANLITVEIFNGGITEFRVSDNAPRILSDETPSFVKSLCLATEKDRTTRLWKLLNFLSRDVIPFADVEIAGKTYSGLKSIALHYYRGQYLNEYQTASLVNTCVTVKNLFFNDPKKYKQLRGDSYEAVQVQDTLRHLALRNLGISIRLMSNGKMLFTTSGNQNLLDCIRALYEDSMIDDLITVQSSVDGIQIHGYISSIQHTFKTPHNNLIMLNGNIYDKSEIHRCILEIYSEILPIRRFPFYYLSILTNPTDADITALLVSSVSMSIKNAISNAVILQAKPKALLPMAQQGTSPFKQPVIFSEAEELLDFKNLSYAGILFQQYVFLECDTSAYYFSFPATAMRIKKETGITYQTTDIPAVLMYLSNANIRKIFDRDNPIYVIKKYQFTCSFPPFIDGEV